VFQVVFVGEEEKDGFFPNDVQFLDSFVSDLIFSTMRSSRGDPASAGLGTWDVNNTRRSTTQERVVQSS
jgi:hypothetical protein